MRPSRALGDDPKDVAATQRRCAVLGSPIAHSLSPVLHRAAYGALDLDWSYDAIEVSEAALPGFLASLDGSWVGLSLTMPLKRAAIPLMDDLSPVARLAGAVNTVLFTPEGTVGDNTDVPGMLAALGTALGAKEPGTVAMLGGGATASSALAVLSKLDVGEVTVYVRSEVRATGVRETRDRLGMAVHLRPWSEVADASTADLLISTVPAAATHVLATWLLARETGGDLGAVEIVPQPRVLFDVAYDPWPTPLAAAWTEAGGRVVCGLDLLVQQAALQVELMSGLRPAPLEAMRAAGEGALAARRRQRTTAINRADDRS
jgi:shikimate dehydrogenase